MIKVEHLYKNYSDSVKVLFDVNFTFEDGEAYTVIGNSGGGRSTFIRCLNVLEVPTDGDIFYNEARIDDSKADLARVREKIGVVFQNFSLFDHMKAIDNVTYTLRKVKKMNAEEARAKGPSLLEKISLRHRADAYPHQLSGGEEQRYATARVSAMKPDILLFDEPTSALNPEMTGEVLKILQDLNHTGITMVVVAHEMSFTKEVTGYVIYIDKGNIEERSKATEFFGEPGTARVGEFLSKVIWERKERK